MKVVIYARVSTTDQSENGVSLDAQQAKMAAYAGVYDLEVVETVVDAGESAKSLDRPGLQHALGLLASGKADGMVVVKLDRLTRSVADWQTLIDNYFGERAGKQLFSVADSIDTRTAAGRLVLNVLLSVAQWERETTGERTREALRHKIKIGERCGKIRFGYDLAADGKTLVPNADEQRAIDAMTSLRAGGSTLRQIAAELSARGIRTKEGSTTWAHTAVGRILNRQRKAAWSQREAA
jgi:site-specific DNA recombinase